MKFPRGALVLLSFLLFLLAVEIGSTHIAFIILSQDNSYHEKLTKEKHEQILNQAKELNQKNILIYSTNNQFPNVVGYWTLFPIMKSLLKCDQCSWFFFCEDTTHVNLKRIIQLLSEYDTSDDVFAGYALKDKYPTIIHHFAPADESALEYPHFSSGFFLSSALVKRLASKLPLMQDYGFSIDPKHEFAKFVWDGGTGTTLSHEPRLCITKNPDNCATWIDAHLLICEEEQIFPPKIFVAVKTCQHFHEDRVKVVKNTWAKDMKDITFFSNVEDKSIPTIQLGVENVDNGHCEKTLEIMRYFARKDISDDWIVIVDDDTLLSPRRLKKVLSCYNSSENIALGERYGYNVATGQGYDYITGGGGMVFSMPTIRQIVKSCRCPSIDSPDDMILGICLKNMGISVIHSPLFHQARPIDYSSDFLKPLKHVSFHKHWMIDTHAVYKEWLEESETMPDNHHSEL